jgi:hypothetical protein
MTSLDLPSLVCSSSPLLFTLAALVLAHPIFPQASSTQSASRVAVRTTRQEGTPHPSSTSHELQIRYTGKLFGYYRMEADEPLDRPKLSAVRRFLLAESSKDSTGDTLLLGMGDNFAPEFGASLQQEVSSSIPCFVHGKPPQGKDAPKSADQYFVDLYEDHYKSSTRKPPLADCDNVTRFLMAAGYRVVVPGREDFLYGGTWLRRIALLLRGASEKQTDNPFFPDKTGDPSTPRPYASAPIRNSEAKLHILAANVRVSIVDATRNSGKPAQAFCPLLFSRDLADENHACVQSKGTFTQEMDWFRRLEETLNSRVSLDATAGESSHAIEGSIVRQARASAGFRRQLVVNQFKILQELFTSYGCEQNDLTQAITELADDKAYQAVENANQLVVIGEKAKKSLETPSIASSDLHCGPAKFMSLSPPPNTVTSSEAIQDLHEFAGAAMDAVRAATNPAGPQGRILVSPETLRKALDLFLNLIYNEQKDAGYTIAELPSGKHALIIGVVGQETFQEISATNQRVYPEVGEDGRDCPAASSTGTAGNRQNQLQSGDKAEPSPVCKIQSKPGRGPEYSFASPDPKDAFSVTVGDPRFAVSAILAAAWTARMRNPGDPIFDTVIVMAQMPPAEAEELVSRVRLDMAAMFRDPSCRPNVDVAFSESQDGHETPNLAMYVAPDSATPVLVPPDGREGRGSGAAVPVSIARITPVSFSASRSGDVNPTLTRLLVNVFPKGEGSSSSSSSSAPNNEESGDTAATLLQKKLDAAGGGARDLDTLWESCKAKGSDGKTYDDRSCQDNVLMQYLLHLIERNSHADVAMLERRDFYFDWLGPEYSAYPDCKAWQRSSTVRVPSKGPHHFKDFQSYCELRAALDRVLWKGDLLERVMIDGTTLSGLMSTAQQQTDDEQSLIARDVHQAWLTTYGIVGIPATNLVTAAPTTQSFYVPGSAGCTSGAAAPGAAPGTVTYCVDGAPVAPDHAYWIATSDHLAQDEEVYKNISALIEGNGDYAQNTEEYLSAAVAGEILSHGELNQLDHSSKPEAAAESSLTKIEQWHQNRSLVQLDFSKLVAGFTFFHPSLTDSELASDLSGVANTQATTPHSQELDLETASRLIFSMPGLNQPSADLFAKYLTFGAQTDAEYDRKVLGNLTGNPETVTYSLNSYTAGGFVQIPVDARIAPHPHAFIVVAPYQYQRQMTGAYLNFAYLSAAGVSNSQQQLSVHAPYAWGFSQRIGFRYQVEANTKWGPDPGSYGEVGPEYGDQNNVLSAFMLPQVSSTAICSFVATQSIQTCVKNAYKAAGIALNGSSTLVPVAQTLHAGGVYFTMHLQKQLPAPKKSSVTFDTQGDSFLWPGATLTTQERYGITTNLSVNFPIFGNVTLSPTYSDFFFENQGAPSQRTSVAAPTYTVVLKWYFVRDSAVPFRRQSLFSGPATASQTSTSKLK